MRVGLGVRLRILRSNDIHGCDGHCVHSNNTNFMTFTDCDQKNDGRTEGRKEGRTDGRKEGRREVGGGKTSFAAAFTVDLALYFRKEKRDNPDPNGDLPRTNYNIVC